MDVAAKGIMVFSVVDQAKLAADAGIKLRPSTLLVFGNPDQSVVIAMQNDLGQELPVRVKVGDKVIASTLEADSFNTFVVGA